MSAIADAFERAEKMIADRDAEIARLNKQPSNEVIEGAMKAMMYINEDATGLPFSDVIRRMAIAAIGVYRQGR